MDSTSGIKEVSDNITTQGNSDYYTLAGVKVKKTAHAGIYICNGKKIIMK